MVGITGPGRSKGDGDPPPVVDLSVRGAAPVQGGDRGAAVLAGEPLQTTGEGGQVEGVEQPAEAADGGDRKVPAGLCQGVVGESAVGGELGEHGRRVAQPARAVGVIDQVQSGRRRGGDPDPAGRGGALLARHIDDAGAGGELEPDPTQGAVLDRRTDRDLQDLRGLVSRAVHLVGRQGNTVHLIYPSSIWSTTAKTPGQTAHR